MSTLLQINASILGEQGQSSQLAARFVAAWNERNPAGHVIRRDLAVDPAPHLTAARFAAFNTPLAQRDAEQRAVAQYSEALIEEIRRADVLVLGLPMYNFGVPSQLKAYVFAARGGLYAGTALDTQTQYVRDFLRFVGISDVEFVYAEGLAIGNESRESALSGARAQIDQLFAQSIAA